MPCLRCAARKPNGDQCRLTTCARSPYCWMHLRQKNGLIVKTSTIPGAGKGLFTTIARAKNANIIEYTGEHLDRNALNQRYPGDRLAVYAMHINRNHYVDARDPQRSSVARYANDCRRRACNNCRLSVYRGVITLKANRRIAAGEELFASYGRDYWRGR